GSLPPLGHRPHRRPDVRHRDLLSGDARPADVLGDHHEEQPTGAGHPPLPRRDDRHVPGVPAGMTTAFDQQHPAPFSRDPGPEAEYEDILDALSSAPTRSDVTRRRFLQGMLASA